MPAINVAGRAAAGRHCRFRFLPARYWSAYRPDRAAETAPTEKLCTGTIWVSKRVPRSSALTSVDVQAKLTDGIRTTKPKAKERATIFARSMIPTASLLII